MIDSTHRRKLLVAMVVGGLLLSATAAPATGQDGSTSALLVDLHEDGSATMTLPLTFDLRTEAERDAFRTLKNDEAARENLRIGFRDRMQAVAADAENLTGRDMQVTDASVEVSTKPTAGVVRLTVDWSGLAAGDGTRLVITEPFAGGFSTDRPVVVRAPEGYMVTTATPSPTTRNHTLVRWEAGSNLGGFEVVLEPEAGGTGTANADTTTVGQEPEASPPSTTRSPGQPGFGPIVGVIAFLVAGASIAAARRG